MRASRHIHGKQEYKTTKAITFHRCCGKSHRCRYPGQESHVSFLHHSGKKGKEKEKERTNNMHLDRLGNSRISWNMTMIMPPIPLTPLNMHLPMHSRRRPTPKML